MNLMLFKHGVVWKKQRQFFESHARWRKFMKWSMIQLCVFVAGIYLLKAESAQSQNLSTIEVNIGLDNESLKSFFDKIQEQSGLLFAYQPQVIEGMDNFNLKEERRSVKETLEIILNEAGLSYKQVGSSIVVYKVGGERDTQESPVEISAKANSIQDDKYVVINGKVVAKGKDEVLIGASIVLKGSLRGTATNAKGTFSFAVKKGDVLITSCIGYKTKEIVIDEFTPLVIELEEDYSKLDEVMVIGYGTTTRRTSTGSVSKISAKEIQNQPVTNILQALQGRTPGVYISQTSGYAGSGIDIKIRGENSIEGDNLPLYVIDGVPFVGNDLKEAVQNDHIIQGAQKSSSPLNLLNPSDIESVEILKDADATAIYGSRGANGVVLITTKKGTSGKTSFSVNASVGTAQVAKKVKTLKTPEYLDMMQTALTNASENATVYSTGVALLSFDQNAYTDWQDELIGDNATTSDVSATLSGGNGTTSFLVSGSYHGESTVIPGSFDYKKISSNLKVNHATFNNRLKLGASVLLSVDDNKLPYFDMASYAFNTAPNHTVYNEDGSYYWSPTYYSDINPLAVLNKTVQDKGLNLVGSFNLNFDITKALRFKVDLGYGRAQIESQQTLPASAMNWAYYENYGISLNSSRSFTTSTNYTENFTVDPQFLYTQAIGKGSLTVLAGSSWQHRKSEMPSYVSSFGYSSDNLIGILSSATNYSAYNGSSEYKYASVFGRLTYNYAGKYIGNINFRRDGSSRFGANHRYGNFSSVGAAWIFSEENFAKNVNWLSFGKLRGSYGKVGSDAIGDYGYADTYSTKTYAGNAALYPSRIANPNYQWEVTRKFETALELGFLKDRISLGVSYYRNISGNQLINSTLSAQAGFTSYQANFPAKVENKGWEFTLNTTNIHTEKLVWSTMFNISLNRNKLKEFPDIEESNYYATYVVGKPLNSIYRYHFAGVDENGETIVEDLNNDGIISSGLAATGIGDRAYIGSSDPKFYGGFQNTISYKRFSLDFLFQFVKKKGSNLMAQNGIQPGYAYGFANFQADELADYLALGHTLKSTYLSTYFNYIGSDATWINTSYVKLKNVNLSYTFSPDLIKKAGMTNLRLYVLGQNLFTITKYKGWDPETAGIVLPTLRTITFGAQVSF